MVVALFVPNLIGYARFALILASFYYAFTNPNLFMLLYCSSYLGDMADGYTARLLNQCSQWGALLDMIVDRLSTGTFFVVLMHVDAKYSFIYMWLMGSDYVSHWFHMFSSYYIGNQSHKGDNKDENFLVRFYYKNKYMLLFTCILAEAAGIIRYSMLF